MIVIIDEIIEAYLEQTFEPLVKEMLKVIEMAPEKLLKDPNKFKALKFVYNDALRFSYVAFPVFASYKDDPWFNTHIFSVAKGLNENLLIKLLKEKGYRPDEEDDTIWTNEEEWDDFEMYELDKYIQKEIFSKAWKRAKEISGTKVKCFVERHDCGGQMDADTGEVVNDQREAELISQVQ